MLVSHNLEENVDNDAGDALTLYFDSLPSDDEVRKACVETRGKHNISCDPDDPVGGFGWKVCPTSVSARAGLTRVQVWPCG